MASGHGTAGAGDTAGAIMAGEIAAGMHMVADAAGAIAVVMAGATVAKMADAMDMRADAAHIRVDSPATGTEAFMAAKAKPEALAATADIT